MKKRLMGLTISVLLLGLLLWHVSLPDLLANLRRTHWGLFAVALVLFIPQTLAIAWRWKQLVAPFAPLPLAESVRLVLAGSTMNLVLPGKMGDLTKGWFLAKQGAVSKPLGLGVVVFEKMLDVAALAAFMLIGALLLLVREGNHLPVPLGSLMLAAALGLAAVGGVAVLYFVPLTRLPGMAWLVSRAAQNQSLAKVHRLLLSSHNTMEALQQRHARRGAIIGMSGLIWALHLAQIYLFFACVDATPTVGKFFAMVPLAIFVGLLPISIAGFGTRDAAFVALLTGIAPAAVLAASFYVNLRYLLPALAGVAFLARYASQRAPDHP